MMPPRRSDLYAANESGFHHVALNFGDHDARVAHYNSLGFESATHFLTDEGRGATYLDTTAICGHMTEIYVVNDSLKQLYAEVRSASESWDGGSLRIER